jgi:hypothetical protein
MKSGEIDCSKSKSSLFVQIEINFPFHEFLPKYLKF